MSFVVHGYRLAEGVELFDFLKRAQSRLLEVQTNCILDDLHWHVTHTIDHNFFGGMTDDDLLSKSPLSVAIHKVDDALKDKFGYGQDSTISFSRDEQDGRFYLLLHSGIPEMRQTFESLPELEDYSYWNNSDQPKELTEEEWNNHKETWERILYTDVPLDSMPSLTVQSRLNRWTNFSIFSNSLAEPNHGNWDVFSQHAPSAERRLFLVFLNLGNNSPEVLKQKDLSNSDPFRLLFKVEDAVKESNLIQKYIDVLPAITKEKILAKNSEITERVNEELKARMVADLLKEMS